MPEHIAWFLAQVDKGPQCWTWQGRTRHGYGLLRLNGVELRVHRVAYHWLVGPLDQSLTIDHRRRVRACVPPDHLEMVSPEVNAAVTTGRRCLAGRGTLGSLSGCRRRGEEITAQPTEGGTTTHSDGRYLIEYPDAVAENHQLLRENRRRLVEDLTDSVARRPRTDGSADAPDASKAAKLSDFSDTGLSRAYNSGNGWYVLDGQGLWHLMSATDPSPVRRPGR